MYSTVENVAASCIAALASLAYAPFAYVRESGRTIDLAISARGRRLLLRCTDRPKPSDYQALASMLAEGDFDRAILVYSKQRLTPPTHTIETCWIGHIEALATSLAMGPLK